MDIYSCPIIQIILNEQDDDFNDKNLKHLCDYTHFRNNQRYFVMNVNHATL